MILVAGASGHVGSELVNLLETKKRPVRTLICDAGTVGPGVGVENVSGDSDRPETPADASNGVAALFLPGDVAGTSEILAYARKAGAAHVVLLSSRAVIGGDPDDAVVRMHCGSEIEVHESGLGWTVLRPSALMSDTLRWCAQLRAGDVVRAPIGGLPTAAIDPRDVAAVTAAVIGRPEHYGLTYELSGPVALRPADRLAILAKVLGRELRLEAQIDGECAVDGEFDDTRVLPTVERLTGRLPHSFAEWAAAHVAAFR